MMKIPIVYNACYGGFSLSVAAIKRYAELTGITLEYSGRNISRTDPFLVQIVKEMGEAADGRFARLTIEELPTGTRYRITEYDGLETVETVDSIEWCIA